jgi:diphosphomevalonate decarboxylase
MITKKDIVNLILKEKKWDNNSVGKAFAPSNIALAKYWGKRDTILNLPMNSSLSISLGHKGATAITKKNDQPKHQLFINKKSIDPFSKHGKRLINYLNLFPDYYQLELNVNIPFAAGLASSACVFAAIILSLNQLYEWDLTSQELSILARLGSGSASRSIQSGFMLWKRGNQDNGMDSFGSVIQETWSELCVGLCVVDSKEKLVSSRQGMQRTVDTSPLYSAWPSSANDAVINLQRAISVHDFSLLGKTAEQNALAMHATMLSAWPPLLYSTEQTIQCMQKIWDLRHQGLELYFTQDAGPNLKLLFLAENKKTVTEHFPEIDIMQPFNVENTQ